MDELKALFLEELGKRIKEYRLALNMSLEELAHKCGYGSENSRSTMQKIESGKSDLPVSKIKKLAAALEISVDELVGWNVETVDKEEKKPTKYDLLDSEDKAKVDGFIEALLLDPKYKKDIESKAI